MKINLKDQQYNSAFPARCIVTYTGSCLPIELCAIPEYYSGLKVAAVKIKVTNADGVAVEVACTKCGRRWLTRFAASNFLGYGFISRGYVVTLGLQGDDGAVLEMVLAVGDVDIRAIDPGVRPGAPGNFFATKGGEVFVRSNLIGGVQHFVRQVMSYDEEIGWGADWTGDYILDGSGNFIPANGEQEEGDGER